MNCYLVCILHVPVEVATRIWLTSYVFAAILQGVLIFQKVVGFNDLDYTKRFSRDNFIKNIEPESIVKETKLLCFFQV